MDGGCWMQVVELLQKQQMLFLLNAGDDFLHTEDTNGGRID